MISAVQISCSTDIEPLDSNIILDPDNIYNPNNPGDGGTDNPISDGDYWPMTVGNSWQYDVEGNPDIMDMSISSSEIINGQTYFKYENFFGQSSFAGTPYEGKMWSRKSGANYYIRQEAHAEATPGMPSITVSPIEMIILKDNLSVDQTWEENVNQTTIYDGMEIVSIVNLVGKVLEKDSSITIGDHNFTNVIKTHIRQTTQGQVINSYYWFAKDIGIIKYEYNFMGTNYVYTLTDYQIL